ncbi:MAG TPA: hypothetical protein VGG46_03920 [Terriglobales bacterium]|jgi:hypothetical protein
MANINISDDIYRELQTIIKLHAHAKSCKKIGNAAEAKTYQQKADKLAVMWFRKIRFHSKS